VLHEDRDYVLQSSFYLASIHVLYVQNIIINVNKRVYHEKITNELANVDNKRCRFSNFVWNICAVNANSTFQFLRAAVSKIRSETAATRK